MTTEKEKKLQEIQMFGMTLEQVIKERELNEPMFAGKGQNDMDLMLYSMQILSDAQYVLKSGQIETARQLINKAKFWITEVWLKEGETK